MHSKENTNILVVVENSSFPHIQRWITNSWKWINVIISDNIITLFKKFKKDKPISIGKDIDLIIIDADLWELRDIYTRGINSEWLSLLQHINNSAWKIFQSITLGQAQATAYGTEKINPHRHICTSEFHGEALSHKIAEHIRLILNER